MESDSFEDEEEYGDIELSDFDDEEDDYSIEDLINDLESDDEEPDLVDDAESSDDYEDKEPVLVDDEENQEESEESTVIVDVLEDDSINELKIKNLSISLDLWLSECVDKGFAGHFLSYKNFKVDENLTSMEAISNLNKNKEYSIDAIVSNYNLEEILEYKYKHFLNEKDFKSALMKLLLPIGVITLVDIAKKHNISISLTKDGLIKNFLEVFSPYELIKILNDEGLGVIHSLDIPVLEQIYLLNESQLEKISRNKCPNGNSSKIDLMSCIIKHYDESFLLSHNKLEGVE